MKILLIASILIVILSVLWAGIVVLGSGMSTVPRFELVDLLLGAAPLLFSALLAAVGVYGTRNVAERRALFFAFVGNLVLAIATLAYLLLIFLDMNL